MSQRAKILIADDEAVVRDLFLRVLSAEEFEVFAVEDGCEAVEAAQERDFDVIVLDLKMPRKNGMSVLAQLKEARNEAAVVIITGHATLDTVKDAMRQGCFDYIVKPFDIDLVTLIVRRAAEFKKLQRQKRSLQEQLQRSQRLSVYSEVGAEIAQQAAAVVSSAKMFFEMLKPKFSKHPQSRQAAVLLEEIERAESLVKRFLAFSQPRTSQMQEVDINSVVESGAFFFRRRFQKQGVDVSTELAPDLPAIPGDPKEIAELLLNLFTNCLDAMPGGGSIAIRTSKDAGQVNIAIRDSGEGIKDEHLPKVYYPFFTTRSGGTGLGLSIAHRIVERHSGTINISSSPGKGTTVCVAFPCDGERSKRCGGENGDQDKVAVDR